MALAAAVAVTRYLLTLFLVSSGPATAQEDVRLSTDSLFYTDTDNVIVFSPQLAARAALDEVLAGIPNLIHPEVPEGGEDDARELHRVGEPPAFGFAPRDHLGVGVEAPAGRIPADEDQRGNAFGMARGGLRAARHRVFSRAEGRIA